MAKKFTAVLAAGLLLTLSACAAEPADMPQDETHKIASEGSPTPTPEVQNLSTAEVAATAGAVIAAKLGFPNSAKIQGEDLAALAEKPTDTLKDIVVLPGNCAAPVDDLNWSPVQLGTEAARTDFTNESQNITGSIEVAKLENDKDRQALQGHFANVSTILADCQSVKINGLDYSETLKFSDPKVESADSALYYTRNGKYPQDSLVLITAAGDYAGMVSFVSSTPLDDKTFNQVATSILDTAMTQVQ
ncbi:hypothetical protein [Glutamicibacter protophormiae]|uniref:Sensor domain-containing protein n=1 Tax=Glutamicibacter protophormiae TaxID=37930 RepID=A0ABS4XKK1_GLUPR|nr:hypothetical protein [Glutamicibacter protophormiae]MBP2397037.1 hypothetical protein [Glutamicibacter protophormiae]GGL91938.1 hypothetical protein GCM10010038_22360 [Glutamicibacter protophormiae]